MNSYYITNSDKSLIFAKKVIMANKDYDQLKAKLEENKIWPLLYMFKFIAPNEDGKVKQVESLLPKGGEISHKHTKNLKYVSVSCKVKMPNAQSIVDVMERITKIEGIISL